MKHQRLISTSLLSLHLHRHGYCLNLILMHAYAHLHVWWSKMASDIFADGQCATWHRSGLAALCSVCNPSISSCRKQIRKRPVKSTSVKKALCATVMSFYRACQMPIALIIWGRAVCLSVFTFIPYSCANEKVSYFLHTSTKPEPCVGDASDTGGQR